MSSLLEEAIVDAKTLKDAALKNAENAVLEKYSAEIKGALSTLLEQDDLGLGLEEEAEDTPDMSFTDDIPFAFQTEELDAPVESELIEIDFNQLKARISEEEAEGLEASSEALIDPLEMAEAITPAMLAADSQEDTAEIGAGRYVGQTVTGPGSARREDDEDEDEDLEEDMDIALTEEMLSDLIEELVVDMTPRPQGWASINSADNSIEQANTMAAAQRAHLEEEEEIEEVSTAPDVVSDAELFEANARIKELIKSTKELRALLTESKTQLTKLNLENAKLVYQNKALNSTSLNERQKKQIVDAVQSANSVEEATMIFETIQNAVGASSDHRTRPQTLREAVTRPTSLLINSKKNNKVTKDPAMGRMLRLAGLTKQ